MIQALRVSNACNSRQFKCIKNVASRLGTEVIDIKPFRRSYTVRFAM